MSDASLGPEADEECPIRPCKGSKHSTRIPEIRLHRHGGYSKTSPSRETVVDSASRLLSIPISSRIVEDYEATHLAPKTSICPGKLSMALWHLIGNRLRRQLVLVGFGWRQMFYSSRAYRLSAQP